jgi:hypothetical protein
MRGYVESDPVVWRFPTLEETDQDFMNYELAKVTNVEVDLDHWSKRTHGARSHNPKT